MSWGGQGQSGNTMLKNLCLRNVIDSILDKTYYASLIYPTWVTEKSPFIVIDLNCGSGYNETVKCAGSPLILVNSLLSSKLNPLQIKMAFIDWNATYIETLRNRPELNLHNIHIQDAISNSKWLEDYSDEFIGTSPLGLIYCDPNGATIPLSQLAGISQKYLQFDIVIHLSATVIKRNNGAYGKLHTKTLNNITTDICRDYWYIRRNHSKWQWIMLIGSNIPLNLNQLLNFHSLDSKEGQDILNYIS